MRLVLAAICVVLAAIGTTGCDTTQDKNTRAELAAERELGSRKRIIVRKPDPRIRVERVQRVGRGKKSVVVARVTNTSIDTLADLPISVGVRRGARVKWINDDRNLNWFLTHVPALGPGQTITWVAELGAVPEGKLVARVGSPSLPELNKGTYPSLPISQVRSEKRMAVGSIRNDGGVTQYIVQLYATAIRRGKYVAAGRWYVTKLAGGEENEFSVPLAGRVGNAKLEVTASPGVLVR